MCKEMPVIPVNSTYGGPKKNSWNKWRAEEEEKARGVADPKNVIK
jgi:hypothetical protein